MANEGFRRVEDKPQTADIRDCGCATGLNAPNVKNGVSPVGLVDMV